MIKVIIALFALWQLTIFSFELPSYILPSPFVVAMVLYHQYALLFSHFIATFVETLLGLLFGIICGCGLALLMAFFRPVRAWFLPFVLISQAIPVFAIAPLLIIWLGYGMSSKIVVTMLIIFFPITSAFYDGLRQTSHGWLDLAKTMEASAWQIFRHVRIPAALPKLASGLRIAAAAAPLGAIIGEWVGSSEGLGYLMITANAQMQTDVMFAALILIIILALGLYFSVDYGLKKLVWWESV